MVGGVTGRRTANAKTRRAVVRGGKLVLVPAPTHPPQEVEGTARENLNSPRNVDLSHAKV